MPAAYLLSPSIDLELAVGPYCFNDSAANPAWLRGRCENGAPLLVDQPLAPVSCGRRAAFEIVGLQNVSRVDLRVGSKAYRLKPRAHRTQPQGTYFTARWRVRGHSGPLTLSVMSDQGRIEYLARLKIRHPGCR